MTNEAQGVNTFAELWARLTPTQKKFAVAMQEYPTKKEAAEAIGLKPQTVYNFNGEVDAVIDFMTNNIALATLGIIQANATKAAQVKANGLDSGDERIQQAAATEILDRNLGKPVQRSELTGGDGEPVSIKFIQVSRSENDES